MIPQERVKVEGEDKDMFDRLMNMLDLIEDVQNVYHNVEE